MLNCTPINNDFNDRIQVVRRILDATRLSASGQTASPGIPDVSREARGMAIVLLYAAYESLLRGLSRSMLEVARNLRVGNRRLQPGYQVAAAFSAMQAISDVKTSKIWKDRGPQLITNLFDPRSCTIDETIFPDTGDNFRRGQLVALCDLLGLGNPAPVLREAWDRLDTIVTQRNQIAHGQETATEIGRRYSDLDLTSLVDIWELRWTEFLAWAETQGRSRDLYRRVR
jgi:hypothetical protein